MLPSILMMLLAVAGAGLVATILVKANAAVPESTQLTPAGRQLRDSDPLIAAKLDRVSQSMCRLLEDLDAMKAERVRAVVLEKRLTRSPTRLVRSGDLQVSRLAA